MNTIIKTSVAVALLGAASAPVFAQAVTNETVPGSSAAMTQTSDSTNGSGVVVEIFDATTGHSMTAWLGQTYTQFAPAASEPAAGEILNFGTLSGFSTFLSSEETATGGSDNLQFAVFAGQNVGGGNRAIETTVASGSTPSNGSVTNALGKLAQAITTLTSASGCNAVNPCVALTTSDPGYTTASLGPNFGGTMGATTVSAALGSNLDFFKFTSGAVSLSPSTKVPYANATGAAYWTVSTSGDVEYVVPAPVPLPAAAWLLGSGLLGLLGIGRRRALAV